MDPASIIMAQNQEDQDLWASALKGLGTGIQKGRMRDQLEADQLAKRRRQLMENGIDPDSDDGQMLLAQHDYENMPQWQRVLLRAKNPMEAREKEIAAKLAAIDTSDKFMQERGTVPAEDYTGHKNRVMAERQRLEDIKARMKDISLERWEAADEMRVQQIGGTQVDQATINEKVQRPEREAKQLLEQQKDKYTAELNSYMQLVAKSDKISDQIKEANDMKNVNPTLAENTINTLLKQKEGIDKQLAQTKDAILKNPLYQGTTLVNPADTSVWTKATPPQDITFEQTPSTISSDFIEGKFSGKNKYQINAISKNAAWKEFRKANPNIEYTQEEFEKAFESAKQEALEIAERGSKMSMQDKRDYNEKLELAAKNLANQAELQAMQQKSKTNQEFVNNLGEGFLKNLATQQGLAGADWKALGNAIFESLNKQPKKAGIETGDWGDY
jgi:hypothetical protein